MRVRLPDGEALTATLAADATIADVRAFIVASASASALPRGGFNLWNAWPRERVDESVRKRRSRLSDSARDRRSSSSRGTDRVPTRVAPPIGDRFAPAAVSDGGFLRRLVEILRRVWAAISLFLGLGGERGGGAEGTPVNTQEAAWAAATRGVEASRARGGGGGGVGGTGGGARSGRPGGGPRGNIRTLGSSRDDDDDGQNRFDNGNSTVWGGGGGDDGDDGRGGGTMDVF